MFDLPLFPEMKSQGRKMYHVYIRKKRVGSYAHYEEAWEQKNILENKGHKRVNIETDRKENQ